MEFPVRELNVFVHKLLIMGHNIFSKIRTIVLKYLYKSTRVETPQPPKTEITTHAVKGAILRARVLDTQKPAPPVANQNSDTF